MDSEIGVGNLPDTFQYNALSDIVTALQLKPPAGDFPEGPTRIYAHGSTSKS